MNQQSHWTKLVKQIRLERYFVSMNLAKRIIVELQVLSKLYDYLLTHWVSASV